MGVSKRFSSADTLKAYLKTFRYEKLNADTPVSDKMNFVVMDTETTGLNAAECEIIDVAAIRFRDGQPVETYSTLLRPHTSITAEISAINHITNEMVEGKPFFTDVVPELAAFVGTDNILGQNLSFDLGFLLNYGLEFPAGIRFYDTMLIGRERLVSHFTGHYDRDLGKYVKTENVVYDIENHKLCTLCDYYGVELIDAHRAENDALATGKLFVAMGKREK